MSSVSKTPSETHETRDASAWALLVGIALGVFWSAGVSAFLIGYHEGGLAEMEPRQLAGMVFIALAPTVTFAIAGWAVREVMRFQRTARLLDYSARRLAAPVANVKADARSVADTIAEQVERVRSETETALVNLSSMEDKLREQADAINAATENTRNRVDSMMEQLRQERTALSDMSDHLRTETDKMSETIERQTNVISTATNVAANQAEEGRSLLDRSAGAMTEAAGSAQRAAEKAALAIDEQLRDMQALVTALEQRGSRLEDVARIHSENVKIVQQTAHELNLAADAGADSMRSASDAAIEQARRIAEVIEKETERAVQHGMEEIERMRRTAQSARESAESAGLALEANADAVIERVRHANASTLEADRTVRRLERARSDRAPEPRSDLRDDSHHREALLEDDAWREERTPRPGRSPSPEPPLELTDPAPPHGDARGGAITPERDRRGGRRSARYDTPPPGRMYDDVATASDAGRDTPRVPNGLDPFESHASTRDEYADYDDRDAGYSNGRRTEKPRLIDDLDDEPQRRNDRRGGRAEADAADDDGEWRWRDLLKNIDEGPTGMLAGEAVVTGLRRAGIDPARALDPDMTARVARARRRAGTGEARALVLDGALSDVRRTSAALAADSTLRGRAEEFVGEHARLVRRAIDDNDAGLLSSLLDSDMGRAYLLLDAALADG